MSNNNPRRSTPEQTLGKLLDQFPNVEKTFKHVHVNRENGDEYPLWATYPLLTKEAKRLTIAAYGIYVEGYNKKVRLERKKVKKHNAALALALEKLDPKKVKMKQRHFLSCHGHNHVWEYNKKVFEHNKRFERIIPLKLPQTIKQATEKVFTSLLWAYAAQLFKLKKGKVDGKIPPYSREVNTMEVNTKHLENLKGDFGLYILHCCPDTILNHKNRLIEAGILINNTYHSSIRGTMHHICPEILVVFDDFEKQFVFTDNQLINICKPEIFRDVFISTLSIIKPTVKRVVDSPTTPLRKKNAEDSSPADQQDAVFLRDHFPTENTGADLPSATGAPRKKAISAEPQEKQGKSVEKKDSGAKIIPRNGTETEHTSYLRSLLVVWSVFANNLAAKKYENHKPVPYDVLKYEAMNGSMSRIDFRELLITELLKTFSKIYADHPRFIIVFAGEWYNTIKLWLLSNRFMSGDGNVLCKDTALKEYRKLLFAFTDRSFGAYPVARRSKFVPARPSTFLDPDLKTPGTFMYHYRAVEENVVKKMHAENKLRAKKRTKAEQNLAYTNNLRKLNRAIAQWYNSGSDFAKLFNYSQNNMPPNLHADLPKHLDNFFTNQKKSYLSA